MGRVGILAWLALAACGRIGIDPIAHDAAPTVDADLVTGLIAYYSMDGDPSSAALDSSGHRLDAACTATCPTRAPGQQGLAASFDGTGYYTVADDPLLHPPAFTIAFWMRAAAYDVTSVSKPQLAGIGASWELVTRAAHT
ncbi:MAG: hypothetical protein H0T79_00505, partial [Deltaproteobacteria bacterium]|nr:hypothetical protein [Deltaproteobacteria bacterium]